MAQLDADPEAPSAPEEPEPTAMSPTAAAKTEDEAAAAEWQLETMEDSADRSVPLLLLLRCCISISLFFVT